MYTQDAPSLIWYKVACCFPALVMGEPRSWDRKTKDRTEFFKARTVRSPIKVKLAQYYPDTGISVIFDFGHPSMHCPILAILRISNRV